MNSEFSRFHQPQQEEQRSVSDQNQDQGALEFQSVEEVIRHDASETLPPPELAERLARSIAEEKKTSWWRRLLGGSPE